MRPLRIGLYSPGLTRGKYSQTYGLHFLSGVIRRTRPDTEFYEIPGDDLLDLSPRSIDCLLVSILGPDAALEYARRVKFRKPGVQTLLGGPGMHSPLLFCEVADAVMLGRGEGVILRAINGDYAGMCTRRTGTRANSVTVFGAEMIDPMSGAVGCRSRCNFCQYAWINQYATSQPKRTDLYYVSLAAPERELMLKDLRFSMLTKNRFAPIIAGLDICQPHDQAIIHKPTSFALLKSILHRMAADAAGASGRYYLRMYTIAGYPWHRDFTLDYIAGCLNPQEWPDGVSLNMSLGVSHFAPMVCTPLECAAVSTLNIRQRIVELGAHRRYIRSTGPFIEVCAKTTPSPRIAVTQTIMQRANDPGMLPIVARAKRWEDLADKYPQLIGWLDRMPAPWIRRNNDPRERVTRLYATLNREFPELHVPTPVYPDGIRDVGDRYGVPIYKV